MKKNNIKKVSKYFAFFVFNGQMPRSINKNKEVEEVPFSVPFVINALAKNKIEPASMDNRRFIIESTDKAELLKIVEKVKALFTDNQITDVRITPKDDGKTYKTKMVKVPGKKRRKQIIIEVVKKKHPTNNKGDGIGSRPCSKFKKNYIPKNKAAKFLRKYEKKSHFTSEPIEYTVNMFDDIELVARMTKAQIKRANVRVAMIKFVNTVCKQTFENYLDMVKFVREYNMPDQATIPNKKAAALKGGTV